MTVQPQKDRQKQKRVQKRKQKKAAAPSTSSSNAKKSSSSSSSVRMTAGMQRRACRSEMRRARLMRPKQFFPAARVRRMIRLIVKEHNGTNPKLGEDVVPIFQDLLVDRARLILTTANTNARDLRQSKTMLPRDMAAAIKSVNNLFPPRHQDDAMSFTIGVAKRGELQVLKA